MIRHSRLFRPFFIAIAATGVFLAVAVTWFLSAPLTRQIVLLGKVPLQMSSNEAHGIASDAFHDLLDARLEDSEVEVERAKQEVLGRLRRLRPSGNEETTYHFLVADRDGTALFAIKDLFPEGSKVPLDAITREGEISFRDPQGRLLLGFHRYFPAWRWHILVVEHEDDFLRDASRARLWIYGSGALGFGAMIGSFAFLLRKRIQVPIQALARQAEELRKGSYLVQPEIGTGEILELSETLNRMAEAIRTREARLAELAKFTESSPNLMLKVAPDGSVAYHNRSVTAFLSEHGLPADRPDAVLPLDTPGILRELASRDVRKKEITTRVGGRDIAYTIFGFPDEEAVVFHGVDVTEMKLMESQYFHASKMDTLGRIAGGVAHDFNNLLAGILGYASLMKDNPVAYGAATKAVDGIESAAERGALLTRQLLAFSRKGTHEYAVLDINRVVDEVHGILAQTIVRSVRMEIRKGEDLPVVLGDETHIHQCLMNLCVNARDALPGGGNILVETRRLELAEDRREKLFRIPAGVYALVAVRDDGVGMDESVGNRIFDPFFTTKEKGKGTGLRMSMVYGIVKNHGGFITVDTAPGKGTRVEILLPRGEVEKVNTRAGKVREETVPRTERSGTVLLVDDEDFVRDVGSQMLSALGYEVLTARNGEEGMDVFRKEGSRISMVILDLIMPVMDGRQTLEAILRIDPGARVIISTGYSGEEDVETLKTLGASAVLSKPYTFDRLNKVLTLVEER
jgi:signal transduction histidine kinase/CheY-like chemotaxis protein/HAMP domain-containing protein